MPQLRKNTRPKGLTGLAKHGTTVSLAPARALSSHARRLYGARYLGRYRYARLMFAFDALLVGVIATLALFNLTMLFESYRNRASGISLGFKAPALVAADETLLELTLQAQDGKAHSGVKLRWNLPPWVEVVESSPRLAKDGTVNIGTLEPGQTETSRLLVRIRAKAGTKVQFGFSVSQYDPLLLSLEYSGSEVRFVDKSALTVTPILENAAYVSGAAVPFVVRNSGRMTASAVTLRLVSSEGAAQAKLGSAGIYLVGDLSPGEARPVFLDLGETAATSSILEVQLQDAAQVVEDKTFPLLMASAEGVRLDSVSTEPDGKIGFAYTSQGASSVLLVCAATSTKIEPYSIVDLPVASGTYEIPKTDGAGRDCSLTPIDRSSGMAVIGSRRLVAAANSLPFTAAVRYFSASGDQLGVGPLPPRVGEKTIYWVTWNIGPFTADLNDVLLETELPAEVVATGKFAASVPGDFSAAGHKISWHVPSLVLAGGDKVTLAFEIEFSPTKKNVGQRYGLLGESMLTAKTAEDGLAISATTDGDDTDLQLDEKARDRGVVQEVR